MENNLYDIYSLELNRENKPSNKSTESICATVSNFSRLSETPNWAELRKLQLFCDGFLISDDGDQLPVHKALLATCSPFFKAAYCPPLGGDVIRLQCSTDVLNMIVEFVYTGHCALSESLAKETLIIADMYCIENLAFHCCITLENSLNPENCIGINLLARHLSREYLEIVSRAYILSHFDVVGQFCEDLYYLESNVLEEFLESDLLNVRSESIVQEIIDKWIEQKPGERSDKKAQLIAHVRNIPPWFGLMDLQLLTHWPRAPHQVIITLGGYIDELLITGTMESFDPRANCWLPWGLETHDERAYHGLAVLNGFVYIIGGFDGVQFLASVRRFDPILRCWTDVSHMTSSRCFVSVVVLDNYIYAIGGRNGTQTRLRTCERYDNTLNQWQYVPSMHCKRSDAGCVAIDGKIYIAGGYNGIDILSSVEMYDPETRRWTFFIDLPSPRSGLQLVGHNGRIYALGGYDGDDRLAWVNSISPNGSLWRQEQQMLSSRSNFAAVSFEDRIWAIGGYGQGIGTLRETESLGDSGWEQEPPLNSERSCLAGVVLLNLPNPLLYSYKFWISDLGYSERDGQEYSVDDDEIDFSWDEY